MIVFQISRVREIKEAGADNQCGDEDADQQGKPGVNAAIVQHTMFLALSFLVGAFITNHVNQILL